MDININDIYNILSKSLLTKGILLENLSIKEFGTSFYIEVYCSKKSIIMKLFNPKIEYSHIQNSLKESLNSYEVDYFDNFDNYFVFEVKYN